MNECSLIASSPRFYCLNHPFQAFFVSIAVGLLGVNLHPSFSTGSTYHYSGLLLRLSVLWRYPIGSLFSFHCAKQKTHFRTSSLFPARTAVDSGIWHSTEIDSFVCNWFLLTSPTSANKPQTRHTNIPDRWMN